jgi:hypothetical protein
MATLITNHHQLGYSIPLASPTKPPA